MSIQFRNFLNKKLGVGEQNLREQLSDEVSSLLILPCGESANKKIRSSLENICSRIEVPCLRLILTSNNLISILRRPENQPKMVHNGGLMYLFVVQKRVVILVMWASLDDIYTRGSGNIPINSLEVFLPSMILSCVPSIEDHLECFEVLEVFLLACPSHGGISHKTSELWFE